MAYVIAQPCVDVKHKDCVDVCPVDCIQLESDELDRMLYIDPDECIDCGACEPACPVGAIFPEDAVPAEWRDYVEVNRRWFLDRAAARSRIDELSPRPVADGAPG
jgi:NAD-dependent dihydropyrimidine dehydrogenase PreA subunit